MMRETLRSLGVMAGFVAFALAWAGVEARAGWSRPTYPASVADEVREPSVWLVDGFNVLNVGLLRGRERHAWWGGAARARLLERVSRFEDREADVWVVFDGDRPAAAEDHDARPRVIFSAPADAWLLAWLRGDADPTRVAVVTADQRLAERARRRGARVVPPGAFLARCGLRDESSPAGEPGA